MVALHEPAMTRFKIMMRSHHSPPAASAQMKLCCIILPATFRGAPQLHRAESVCPAASLKRCRVPFMAMLAMLAESKRNDMRTTSNTCASMSCVPSPFRWADSTKSMCRWAGKAFETHSGTNGECGKPPSSAGKRQSSW
eukprot:SAG31_NODE_7213_length_1753_cov_2.334341_2_plen_139_part_00